MLSSNHQNKKKWYSALTLIEIVIAIFIFGIGILGIIQTMIKNIETLTMVKLYHQANFLAKEWIDLFINKRNSNILQWLPADCLIFDEDLLLTSSPCTVTFTSWADSLFFVVWIDQERLYWIQKISSPDDDMSQLHLCKQWSHSGMLSNFCDGPLTLFSRYIEVKPVVRTDTAQSDNNFVEVISHVIYKQGSYTGHVMLQTFLFTSQQWWQGQ
jgi:hypothetical protein